MRIVLDTNVFVAGVFFSGPPSRILNEWRNGNITLVVSAPILEEHRRIMHDLATQFPAVDPVPPLELEATHARLVEAPALPEIICSDPSDDMFLSCAIAGLSRIAVSGDKALLRASGYREIEVLTPRMFLNRLLTSSDIR